MARRIVPPAQTYITPRDQFGKSFPSGEDISGAEGIANYVRSPVRLLSGNEIASFVPRFFNELYSTPTRLSDILDKLSTAPPLYQSFNFPHYGVGEGGPSSRYLANSLGTYMSHSTIDVVRTAAGAVARLGGMLGRRLGQTYTMYSARAENQLYRAFGHVSNVASIPGGWYSYIRYGAPSARTLEEAAQYGIRSVNRGGIYAPVTEREVRRTLQTIQQMPEEVQQWLGGRATEGQVIELHPQEFLFPSDIMGKPYRGVTKYGKSIVQVGARSVFGGNKPSYIFAHEIGHLLDFSEQPYLSASEEFRRLADESAATFRPYVRQAHIRRIKSLQYQEMFAETFAGGVMQKGSPYGVQPRSIQQWVRHGARTRAKAAKFTPFEGSALPHTGPGEYSANDVVRKLGTYKNESTVDVVKTVVRAFVKTEGKKAILQTEKNLKNMYLVLKEHLPGITEERFNYGIRRGGKALRRLGTLINERGQSMPEIMLSTYHKLTNGIMYSEDLPFLSKMERLEDAINSPVKRSIQGAEAMATEMAYSQVKPNAFSYPVGAQNTQLGMAKAKLLDRTSIASAEKNVSFLSSAADENITLTESTPVITTPTSHINLRIVDGGINMKYIDSVLAHKLKTGWRH